VSISQRPDDKNERRATPPRQQRAGGRSGRGADSAMKSLREWEQRRASDRALPPRHKPDNA
jgi:hypothetical protein